MTYQKLNILNLKLYVSDDVYNTTLTLRILYYTYNVIVAICYPN